MTWEIGLGLVTFGSVFGLLRIISIMRSDDEDPMQQSIINGLKTYLVMISILVILGGLVAIPNVIDASIDGTDTAAVDNVKSVYESLYVLHVFLLIPFMFFILILFIIMVANYFSEKKRQKLLTFD